MNKPDSVLYGIRAEEIARRCGVDAATARRWKRGARKPPKTALMIVAGDLGCFDPAWSGWTLRGGKLISPEGWELTAGDALSIPLLRAQLAAYQAKERQMLGMDEQPMPGNAPTIIVRA